MVETGDNGYLIRKMVDKQYLIEDLLCRSQLCAQP